MALSESILQAPAILRTSGSPRYEVIVHVDVAALQGKEEGVATFDDGGAMPLAIAQRIACDAPLVLATIDEEGQVLNVGRSTRSIPPAIRRALRIRDKGCRFPSFTHAAFVDGHHIQHWAHGGETKLDNLVLLCRHHHRLVHEGGFSLTMEADGPVFTDPDGNRIVDPPPRSKNPTPAQMDAYPSFLSWLDELDPEVEIQTPGPVDGSEWDLGLTVGILCQRYSGPVPRELN